MNSVQKFNKLNGRTCSRNYLKRLVRQAEKEKEVYVLQRLNKLLDKHPDALSFELEVTKLVKHYARPVLAMPSVEENPEFLGVPFLRPQDQKLMGQDDTAGLGKAVSSDDIYQMVTDRILKAIKDNGDLTWYNGRYENAKDTFVSLPLPINYNINKYYRGINAFMLSHYHSYHEKREG